MFDEEHQVVVFVNTTRADYCTPEVVAFELAVIQWIIDWEVWFEGGQVGPEPPFPDDPAGGFPEGNDPVLTTFIETGKGAVVFRQQARNLDAEIWPLIENAPLVGPCTDTDPADTPLVGTASISANDNDLFVSGTRGNSFGFEVRIVGSDEDGRTFKYSSRFHVNDRCYAEDGDPACLILNTSFQAP